MPSRPIMKANTMRYRRTNQRRSSVSIFWRLVVAGVLWATGGAPALGQDAGSGPPNFLIFIADDQGEEEGRGEV